MSDTLPLLLPTFDPGDQCAGGCGYAPEHGHCPADDQPDLFGGAA